MYTWGLGLLYIPWSSFLQSYCHWFCLYLETVSAPWSTSMHRSGVLWCSILLRSGPLWHLQFWPFSGIWFINIFQTGEQHRRQLCVNSSGSRFYSVRMAADLFYFFDLSGHLWRIFRYVWKYDYDCADYAVAVSVYVCDPSWRRSQCTVREISWQSQKLW